MPVQETVKNLNKIGKEYLETYPEPSNIVARSVPPYHTNQNPAKELSELKVEVDTRLKGHMKELLEAQELLGLIYKIFINVPKSTSLVKNVKDILQADNLFKDLETYLPEGSNKDYPTKDGLLKAIETQLTFIQKDYSLAGAQKEQVSASKMKMG